jgi:hypothetical protein
MGRANNTSRSLQIISKAQGWDPTEIIGDAYHAREDLTRSDTWPIPASMKDTSEPCPDPQPFTKDFETPVLRENENHRTDNADPFPGMPGLKR